MKLFKVLLLGCILISMMSALFEVVEAEDYKISISNPYIPLGQKTNVTITITSTPNEGIYVGLFGQGVDLDGVTDSKGKVTFSVIPISTGNISIDVGFEGNTVSEKITVHTWGVDVSDPYIPLARTSVVTITLSGTPNVGIYVGLFGQGVDLDGVTDSNGEVCFSLTPSSTGNISIDVGFEGNTVSEKIMVTNWTIEISDPYIPLAKTSTVIITLSGSETEEIYIGLHGIGININDTTDTNGEVEFSITPSSTGNISIDVGAEGVTISEVITVYSWILDVSVSITEIKEGESFTVTVLKEGTNEAIKNAIITISGLGTKKTDTNGQAIFSSIDITEDKEYSILVEKEGCLSDSDELTILVKDIQDTDQTPGFEFILVICSILFIMYFKKKQMGNNI